MEEKITDQHNGLVNISEDLLEKLQLYVDDHQEFHDAFHRAEDWLHNLNGMQKRYMPSGTQPPG